MPPAGPGVAGRVTARGGQPNMAAFCKESPMSTLTGLILWLLLAAISWPLALLVLVLWPVVWLLLLPFRLLGIAVDGVFGLVRALVTLPARLLGGR